MKHKRRGRELIYRCISSYMYMLLKRSYICKPMWKTYTKGISNWQKFNIRIFYLLLQIRSSQVSKLRYMINLPFKSFFLGFPCNCDFYHFSSELLPCFPNIFFFNFLIQWTKLLRCLASTIHPPELLRYFPDFLV